MHLIHTCHCVSAIVAAQDSSYQASIFPIVVCQPPFKEPPSMKKLFAERLVLPTSFLRWSPRHLQSIGVRPTNIGRLFRYRRGADCQQPFARMILAQPILASASSTVIFWRVIFFTADDAKSLWKAEIFLHLVDSGVQALCKLHCPRSTVTIKDDVSCSEWSVATSPRPQSITPRIAAPGGFTRRGNS